MAATAREAFEDLLGALRDIGAWLDAQELGEQDRAEGYRHIAHLLAVGLDHHLESDPDRPLFTRIVSPGRKMQGDNPDAIYFWTAIRGDRSYVIRGRRDGEAYVSFTVHGRDPADPNAERVVADVNLDQLDVRSDGSYQLILSPEEHPGNSIRLEPDAASVVTRHYYERTTPAASDPEVAVHLRIDPVVDPGPPPSWTEAAISERLEAVATFVRSKTIDGPGARGDRPPVPFVSRTPNQLPQPYSFRDSGLAVLGAVDAHYSMGPYALGPDEALVMEGSMPPAAFVNVMLWNRHMQTYEYRFHRTSLNRTQLVLGEGGTYRIVVAHRDPGVPNWLDTEGHSTGSIFWRYFLARERPSPIRCAVVAWVDIAVG